jgi:hypothetical protein
MVTAMSLQQFHLFLETPDGESEGLTPIAIPAEGLSYLQASGPPRLVDGRATDAALLEPIAMRPSPVLMMLRPAGASVLVNGSPPLPVAVIRPGDRIRLGDGHLLRVARYDPPPVGPPPAGAVGTPCSVCRVPLATDTVVYVCPACGLAVHCEGPDRGPADERLECALLSSTCVRCGSPVRPEGGWDHGPDC